MHTEVMGGQAHCQRVILDPACPCGGELVSEHMPYKMNLAFQHFVMASTATFSVKLTICAHIVPQLLLRLLSCCFDC